MEKQPANLLIISGPDEGREFVVLNSGARLGRSSSNDIVLKDPSMSRFHCRFFYKPGEGLWAEDLGSANQTLLNKSPLHVARVHPGYILTIGVTDIRVVSDLPPDTASQNLFSAPAPEKNAGNASAPGSTRSFPRLLLVSAAIFIVAVLGLLWFSGSVGPRPVGPADISNTGQADADLEIIYEKVEASPQNVFRYAMELRGGELSVQVDDLANNRHVAGTQRKKIDPEVQKRLVEAISNSGFFELQNQYKGLSTNIWDQWDLSIILGRRAGRVNVLNTKGPELLRELCGMLEEFGRNELGLAALALTPEKLLELANSAFLAGRAFYDQRMVKHENLALAIRSLKEAEWYLETIEPKPDYYAEVVALLEKAERELQEVFENHMFLAERAIRLSDWQEAATQLRTICDQITDRSDKRHADARRRLIDVDRNLQRGKR